MEQALTEQAGTPKETRAMEEPEKKKGNFIMIRAIERQRKLLRIILKLAAVNGYNDLDHIQLEDGSFLKGSDVVPLLMHALSPGKVVVGLKEFVDLLYRANVTPDLVTNENVKAMLSKLYNTQPGSRVVVKQIQTAPKEPMDEYEGDTEIDDEPEPPRAMKRRRNERDESDYVTPRNRPILKAKRRKLNGIEGHWDDRDSDLDDDAD
ncbi:hypothetical protein HDE_08677 [Halotydeus destructor]|nr:hypothetical protein HDE_08677 [Halotydeus destructor]